MLLKVMLFVVSVGAARFYYDKPPKCEGTNMYYTECGPYCQRSCQDEPYQPCPYMKICEPGCYCLDDFILDKNTGDCVKPPQCSHTGGDPLDDVYQFWDNSENTKVENNGSDFENQDNKASKIEKEKNLGSDNKNQENEASEVANKLEFPGKNDVRDHKKFSSSVHQFSLISN